ncbi:hypothetical protein [Azotobacter salinestris]|nr:hypothetical protein [Azotobacter salinestris]
MTTDRGVTANEEDYAHDRSKAPCQWLSYLRMPCQIMPASASTEIPSQK